MANQFSSVLSCLMNRSRTWVQILLAAKNVSPRIGYVEEPDEVLA